MLDHKNLNEEVPALNGWPITTESLARFCFEHLSAHMPVARVRLFETSWFFAEYDRNGHTHIGMQRPFHAAHRLRLTASGQVEMLMPADADSEVHVDEPGSGFWLRMLLELVAPLVPEELL